MDAPRFDINTLVQEAGLGTAWDYALPIDWVNDVHKVTGFWPQNYGFVWSYNKPTVWGAPYPLTHAAKILLQFYETMRHSHETDDPHPYILEYQE